jgi:peroxiredoxin
MRPIPVLIALAATMAALPAAAEIVIGTKIPASFVGKDTSGKARTLASVAGKNGTVLVLYRSARWCPFCQAQLKDMKALQAPLAAKGYSLVALSYDPPAALGAFAAKTGVGYTLLSDEKSAMIDALGLRDPAYAAGSFAAGVAKASTLVVDAKGTVRWKTVAKDYKIRPQNAAILAAVNALK